MNEKIENRILVGNLERCDLPELAIENLNVRIDTVAATSSLHVDNIEEFERDGVNWVCFDIHPDSHNVDQIVRREVRIKAKRKIKSSNATSKRRFVIDTQFKLGEQLWEIQLTLTDRSGMSYMMLLGRQAMGEKIIVEPSREYLLGDPS